MESASHKLHSSASESIAVGQVLLCQAFSPYAGGRYTVELHFYVVPELNALKEGYGRVMLDILIGKAVQNCVG